MATGCMNTRCCVIAQAAGVCFGASNWGIWVAKSYFVINVQRIHSFLVFFVTDTTVTRHSQGGLKRYQGALGN